MADALNPLVAFSEHTAALVEQAVPHVVAVAAGGRASSGIHLQHGVVVTAEEALEADEKIAIKLPGGREVGATLVGRDPSTDVAVLRFAAEGAAPPSPVTPTRLRVGQLVLALGNHDGAPIASLGMIGFIGGAWQSSRGGAIDSLLRLDISLSPAAEGGALIDVEGRLIGMPVFGPRRRVLAIPISTIERVVDELIRKGRIARGYLGAGLQHVRLVPGGARASGGGIVAVSIDPQGPAARAGLVVGDIITAWNGKPVAHVRDVMRWLGPDSVGTKIDLELLRAGAATSLKLTVGERPSSA